MRLSAADSRARLVAAESAVLGVNDAAGPPLLVPITFAVLRRGGGDLLVFAVDHKPKTSQNLRRLTLIDADPRVTVLADRYDDDWRRLWWVRAGGRAEVLPAASSAADRRECLDALIAKYPRYRALEPQGAVVRVVVDRWTGWSGEDLQGPLTAGSGTPCPAR